MIKLGPWIYNEASGLLFTRRMPIKKPVWSTLKEMKMSSFCFHLFRLRMQLSRQIGIKEVLTIQSCSRPSSAWTWFDLSSSLCCSCTLTVSFLGRWKMLPSLIPMLIYRWTGQEITASVPCSHRVNQYLVSTISQRIPAATFSLTIQTPQTFKRRPIVRLSFSSCRWYQRK